jgi:predicted nucleic acid-binding protein
VILVVDSSALIALSRIHRLELLRDLAGHVYVSQAVYDEVVVRGQGRTGSVEVKQADWIHVQAAKNVPDVERLMRQVGHGEAESIVLAKEVRADFIVLDDAIARRVAEEEGYHVLGLLSVLVYGKQRNLIPSVRTTLDELAAAGFYLDESAISLILRNAGELPQS